MAAPVQKGKVPQVVREAHERGLTPIPQHPSKVPLFRWKKLQDAKEPPWKMVRGWQREYRPRSWAVVTGQPNGLLVLDFDGPAGEATRKKLGLKPHIRTPSGGSHVWVTAPRYKVRSKSRVDPDKFPGMDLKAHGSLATIAGKGYRRTKKREAYALEDLPKALRRLIEGRRIKRRDLAPPKLPEGFEDFTSGSDLFTDALQKVRVGESRNDTGFWLARQLRNERISRDDAWSWMQRYVEVIADAGDHPYTMQEAYNSLVSAYSQPPGWPRSLRDEEEVLGWFSDVKRKEVKWLWQSRIALGKVSIIEGDPDLGKSTLVTDIGARVTRGRKMPDGTPSGGAGVVIITAAEDEVDDTIEPRLAAADARMSRVSYIKLKTDKNQNPIPLTIPDDLDRIERAIKEARKKTGLPAKLLIIDPITAYLSDSVARASGNDAMVRRAMTPLKELAARHGIAILLVRHLNKDGSLRAMYRGGGSIAFTASSRSVMVVEKHPEQEGVYVLARVKMNLSAPVAPITFQIVGDPAHDTNRIEWGEPIQINVDELLRGRDARKDAPEREEAEEFLREYLAEGPQDSTDVVKDGRKQGITESTIRAAKKHLHVRSFGKRAKDGTFEGWMWELPNPEYKEEVTFDFR